MVGEILKTRLMVKKAMKGYKHDKVNCSLPHPIWEKTFTIMDKP